ncbi:MAG: non-canonical purine NTP pyrophosphatase [bacterium]
MFSKIKKISIPQGENNEDIVGSGDNYIYCIDGATGLSKINIMDKDSDAMWFVKKTASLLDTLLIDNNKSLSDILKQCMKDIESEILLRKEELFLDDYDYPSAGIAIARIVNKDNLEILRLGDVLVNIFDKNNNIVNMHDDKLPELDDYAINMQVQLAKENNISVREARNLINDILLVNRKKMNTEDGYFILDPSGNGIDKADIEEFNISNLDSISLMSDGYYCISDTYNIVDSFKSLHMEMRLNKLQSLYDKMHSIQEEDLDYNKYPRFKMRDDSSVIFASLRERSIVFASNNKGKIKEITDIIKGVYILSLDDLGVDIDVLEDQNTFEKNALKKAKEIYDLVGIPVIADDSGLCIKELDNWPGVITDRFLGEGATTEEKNDYIINKVSKLKSREAYVNCSLCYYDGEQTIIVSEKIEGNISLEKRGINGFGFDEIFELPNKKTLAELTIDEKNELSSRKKAAMSLLQKI